MKYLISGYIGFDNFGDELIAHILTEKLKKEGAEKITYISSNPEKTKKLHNVESCGMLKFLKPLKECDTLISGGGSLLQDVTSFKSLLYYLTIIYTALLLNKHVEIYAQGIGPIKSKLGRFLTKGALRFCKKITVRDIKSLELLKSWKIDAELVKDPVFELEIPEVEKQDIIGVQLRNYAGVDERFLKNLAERVVEDFPQKQIHVISLQDSIDLAVCRKFAEILQNSGVNAEVKSGLSLDDAIKEISYLDSLIGMRFHSLVIGIKSNVKCIAVNYDPKVQKLAEEHNLKLIELR